MRPSSLAIILLLTPAISIALIIHVPSEQPTIQEGLNLAQTGDTVFVAAGEYTVDIVSWPNRNGISLIGAGVDSTIVVGDEWQSVVYMTNAGNIDSTTLLKSITFRHGGDAGIILYEASPTIKACRFDSTTIGPGLFAVGGSVAQVDSCEMIGNAGPGIRIEAVGAIRFENCQVTGSDLTGNRGVGRCEYPEGLNIRDTVHNGGGVYCFNSIAPKFLNCDIFENTASEGGGVFVFDSFQVEFVNCVISGNTAWYGGGVACELSSCNFTGCQIVSNIGYQSGGGLLGLSCGYFGVIMENTTVSSNLCAYGGGLYFDHTDPLLSGCNVTGNESEQEGAGIYLTHSNPNLSDCLVSGNIGLGMYCRSSDGTYSNCQFIGNSSGGVYCDWHSEPSFFDCAFVANTTEWVGGGVRCNDNSNIVLSGCAIIANIANIGGGLYSSDESNVTVHNCKISNNYAYEKGGGLALSQDSSPFVTNSEFASNESILGGAVWLSGGGGQFDYSSFCNNKGLLHGDGLHTEGTFVDIENCNFYENGWAVHNADPVAIPSVTGNWWGASSGPWHQSNNPIGEGDSLSVYSWDFLPWLEAADTEAPPFPPCELLQIDRESGTIELQWESLSLADLAGYWVHFDTDSLGFEYEGQIDVGNETAVILSDLETGVGYRIAVSSYDIDGNHSSPGRPMWVVVDPVDVVESGPSSVRLSQAYPNPFNPSTRIRFTLAKSSKVSLSIYSLEGRRIYNLLNESDLDAGDHEFQWNGVDSSGESVVSGIYLYRFTAGDLTETRKMTLLK